MPDRTVLDGPTPVDGPGLRPTLEAACAAEGCPAGALTVLASQNDPFRIDTPARHRDGQWLARVAHDLGLGERRIHLRGLHYMLVSGVVQRPAGTTYTNTDDRWAGLGSPAAKAARWLGYLPFAQVMDARNAEPVVRIHEAPEPEPLIEVGVDVTIPGADDLRPSVGVDGFTGTQPFKLVLFGEKTSLDDVVGPLAESYGADLYLPQGEISDTLLYRMASVGAKDGRPMVVLCLSDCDPAGWQMPISIGRKLQAFRALEYPDLAFQVRRVGLMPEQVLAHGLPSTPLKDSERRADRWQDMMGVEQTEIDALAALRPDLLRKIVRDALAPFYDRTLARRVAEARTAWLNEAQRALDEQIDQD